MRNESEKKSFSHLSIFIFSTLSLPNSVFLFIYSFNGLHIYILALNSMQNQNLSITVLTQGQRSFTPQTTSRVIGGVLS